jgi:hypothetical protein
MAALQNVGCVMRRNLVKTQSISGEESLKFRMRPKGNPHFGCPIDEKEDISFLLYTR